MADSMIERVAEAIFLKEGRATDVAWKDADKVLVMVGPMKAAEYYRAVARAAIEAMREPTERMENAAVNAAIEESYMMSEGETNAIYRAMIDAALSEDGAASDHPRSGT